MHQLSSERTQAAYLKNKKTILGKAETPGVELKQAKINLPKTLTLMVPVSVPDGFFRVTVYFPASSRFDLATASMTTLSVN